MTNMCNDCQTIKKTVDDIRSEIIEIDPDLLPYLDGIAGAFQSYFDKQLLDYIEQATAQSPQKEIKKVDAEFFANFLADIETYLGGAYKFGLEVEVARSRAELPDLDDDVFALSSERVDEYVATRTGELISGVDETTQKQVQHIISDGVKQGMLLDDIADAINEKFVQYNDVRSYLIARMETINAFATAQKDQFEDNAATVGVTGRKKAVSQGDSVVRETHQIAADAGWIKQDEPFPGVDMMRYPFGFGCRCRCYSQLFHPDEVADFSQ